MVKGYIDKVLDYLKGMTKKTEKDGSKFIAFVSKGTAKTNGFRILIKWPKIEFEVLLMLKESILVRVSPEVEPDNFGPNCLMLQSFISFGE